MTEEIAAFQEIKARSNERFGEGDNAGARACYTQVIDGLRARFTFDCDEESDFEVHKMYAASLANRA